jgi:hypothetical protein
LAFSQASRAQYPALLQSIEQVCLACKHGVPIFAGAIFSFFWANDTSGVNASAQQASAAINATFMIFLQLLIPMRREPSIKFNPAAGSGNTGIMNLSSSR